MTFIQNLSLNLNIPKISFRSGPAVPIIAPTSSEPYRDGFSSNPLHEGFDSEEQILAEIRSNPEIKDILNRYKIPIKLNMNELEQLKRGHLRQTRVIAAQIYSALPPEMKEEVNLPNLQEAALLHDYGKVLIPSKILNKSGSLTEQEQEIMHLHSELSYELLKNRNLNSDVLNLIKNHHNPTDLSSQILSTADKYSALTESRCYKEPLSKEEALDIIYEDVLNGTITQEVFDALKKTV